ncbi:MAG: DHH family phosphoesterase [Caldilineales bacterium]
MQQLLAALAGASQVLILPHNDPDPDAIASAVGLRYLLAQVAGIEAQIGYQGIVGRAENKAMVRYLERPLRQLGDADLRRASHIALVDTQPGAGNNPLPAVRIPAVVLDHHTLRSETCRALYSDIRPEQGATSTIVTEYLQAAALKMPESLATALFYGIKTDTRGLGRGAGLNDIAAYYYLQSLVDIEALTEIERAQVPASYFKGFVTAIQAARIYDQAVLSYIGPMTYPDQAAEIADQLSRLENIQWVLCMGTFKGMLRLAVRSRSRRTGAGKLIQAIVGDLGIAGGHGTMAGGQIELAGRDPQQLAAELGQKLLACLKLSPTLAGKPLSF